LYFSTHDFLKLIVEQKLNGVEHATKRMREASTSLRLSSNPSSVENVTLFIESLANKLRIAPDTYGNILISLTEAVNNAIIHGNKQDATKTVEVKTSTRNGCLAISVKDEGKGFDYSNVPDPTTPERLCECGGRGVYLMRQLSVEMEFKIGERSR
jgi:serine/threonine-protein kinase RsbW